MARQSPIPTTLLASGRDRYPERHHHAGIPGIRLHTEFEGTSLDVRLANDKSVSSRFARKGPFMAEDNQGVALLDRRRNFPTPIYGCGRPDLRPNFPPP